MTMRKLVTALFVIAMAGIVIAQTITIEPSDDMYSDPDHDGAHPADELWVANYDPTGNHQRIMIKFDLEDYMGQEIDSAMLNLNRFFGCPSGDPTHTNFYNITVSWDESSWPENTHISHGTTVWANYVFDADGWHQIDITTLVQEWLDGTTPNYGFVIEAIPGNKFSKFYSKEAASSVRPYLELFGATGINEYCNANVPVNVSLQICPNPFNSSCRIEVPMETTTKIYDLNGKCVGVFDKTPCVWTPDESISSGIYLIKATVGDKLITKRAVLIR